VAVLLSGGVDSSLALHLLKAAGHHVTAFYLQVHCQGDPAAASQKSGLSAIRF
jgi:tRNA-specific 2-thiouridylase